jgi:hypothetical protein
VKLGQVANSKPSGVADLIREFDGHSTSLGSMPDWPQSLRTAADMMLASGHATCIAWGKERIFFYNDSYAPILGTRHPEALSASARYPWRGLVHCLRPSTQSRLATMKRFAAKGVHSWNGMKVGDAVL